MLVRESRTNPAKGAFGRRKNRIRVLGGDKVLVEMTPYDLTKGRITATGSNDRMAPFVLVRPRTLQ
jgi:hypothetical protein